MIKLQEMIDVNSSISNDELNINTLSQTNLWISNQYNISDITNKVINWDSLIELKKIPDKSVNLIVIDPPYNIGKDKSWDK